MKGVLPILILIFSSTNIFAQRVKMKESTSSKPFVLGLIDHIQSTELSEIRILNIYLPDGYHQNDTSHYPVIYLLDGSADEDFIHIVGLVQYNSLEWVSKIPKSIVVGIATVDRRRDFTFPTTIQKDQNTYPTSGHSAAFITFLETESQPFIVEKYRTSGYKTIIGQSLGGLLATEILLKKPSLFNKYIIVSTSLWWNNGSLLNQNASTLMDLKRETDIYIAVGKEGLTPTDPPRVMEVDANLLVEKLEATDRKNLRIFFDYLPQENHATILHQAVSNSFRSL